MSFRHLFFIAVVVVPNFTHAQEVLVPPAARKALELTIYENDIALIKDQRDVKLTSAQTTLVIAGVSAQLQPETVLFRTIGADTLQILEQSFDSNVLNQQALLQRAVGREVSVYTANPSTGKDTVERAKVLAIDQGLVLDIGGKIHTQVPGRIVFDSLPEGLRTSPTLLITAKAPPNKDMRTELSYLTSGLSWRTNYVIDFDPDAKRFDLTAWAMLTNATGSDFQNAKVKLISGQVNRAAPPQVMMKAARGGPEVAMAMAAPAEGIQQQSLGGYHLYNIEKLVSVENNRTKQLVLLNGKNIVAKQEHIVRGEVYYYRQQMPEQLPVSS